MEKDNLKISVEENFTKDIQKLLEQTRWGTNNLLFSVPNIAGTIKQHDKKLFITARDKTSGSLLANVMYTIKEDIDNKKILYGSMFSVKENKKGSGIGKWFLPLAQDLALKHINNCDGVYGYVESKNMASINTMKHLFMKPVGYFDALSYTRLLNKTFSKHVVPLKKSDKRELLKLFKKRYENYQNLDIENSLDEKNTFIFKRNDQILAGAQYEKITIKPIKIPTLAGKILTHITPKIPLIKNIFGNQYNFVRIGNVFCEKGNEKYLRQVFNKILQKENVNTALINADINSDLYRQLKKLHLGLLNIAFQTRHTIFSNYVSDTKKPIFIGMHDA